MGDKWPHLFSLSEESIGFLISQSVFLLISLQVAEGQSVFCSTFVMARWSCVVLGRHLNLSGLGVCLGMKLPQERFLDLPGSLPAAGGDEIQLSVPQVSLALCQVQAW